MIIQIKPPYKHLVQKPHLCGATCLQMVLFRRGYWFEQEKLAKLLGTRIKSENKKLFQFSFPTNDQNNRGITLEEFKKAKPLLKKFNLNLKILKISEIKDLKKLILKNLRKGNDLIVNFKRTAYCPEKNWGHFALIKAWKNNQIELCDPSYQDKPYWKTSLAQLKKAMSKKWDNQERGLIIISQK